MEQSKIDEIMLMVKSGYQILEYKPFTLKKPLSFISIFERFFINFHNKKNDTEYCKYSHSSVIAKYKGVYYVYECVAEGLIRTELDIWLKSRKTEDLLLLIPDYEYEESLVDLLCRILHKRKVKYDFKSTLFHQLVRQIVNERLWIGAKLYKRAIRVLNCSEFNAYITYITSNSKLMINWYEIDPQDLFISKNYKHKLL